MNNIEKRLGEEKQRMESITAPEELEMRLRSALHTTAPQKMKRQASIWNIAAVALLFLVIASSNYNAVAFYGKKLLGFDELINGTLQQLNEGGMGQIVDKKVELEDGTDLIINGIMTDANQLVLYYTITNPNGLEYSSDLITTSRITGFLTNSFAGGGTALLNEDQTEMKGTMFFEPVSPFSKKLTLHYRQDVENGQMREDSMTFPYNPNKAMQTEIKQSIKKTVKVDKGSVTFNSIIATPTLTVIDGLLNVKNFNRVDDALGGIELIANGTRIGLMGSGSGSALRGTKFDVRYDALPEQLDSLELVVKEFVGYKKLLEKVPLDVIGDEPIPLDGKDLWIKDVSTTSQGVEITIATDNDVMLDGVSIKTKNGLIALQTTVNQHDQNQVDGREMKERTLLFDTKEVPTYLHIDGMHYMKAYNHTIEIAVD